MFEDDSWDEFRNLRRNMNRLFGSVFSNNRVHLDKELDGNYRNAWTEFGETSEEFIINIELPGVSKEDINLSFADGSLEVRAEKKKEKKHEDEESGRYGYAKSFVGFSRVIDLPENADTSKVKAVFRDGVLCVKLGKKKSKDKKDIRIE